MELKKVQSLKGEVTVPGDKSISHRAVMFGSISKGLTEVTNFLAGSRLFVHYLLLSETGHFH